MRVDRLINKTKRALWQLNLDIKTKSGLQTFETCIVAALSTYKISCVVVVGANKGQFALMLRDLGFRGDIISFEPSPLDFASLADLARRDEKWRAINIGLGSESGTLQLNVFGATVFSSFREPSKFGLQAFPGLAEGERYEVPVKRLDEIECFKGLRESLMLKIDTQGYDDKVYQGAEKILDRVQVLVTEIAFQNIYDGTEEWRESVSRIAADGFKVCGIFPVSRSRDLSLIEANLIMVRDEKHLSDPCV